MKYSLNKGLNRARLSFLFLGFAVHGLAVKLTLLLKIFFELKGNNGKNKQPGVLGQNPDDLTRSFE